jgi:hypothetical protein
MTAITIHQPTRTAGILEPLTGRITAWRETRRIAKLQRQVAAANAGIITVREFLTRLGADNATIRSVESQFGKKIAKAYRETTGHDPAKSGKAIVRGEIYDVYGYGWNRLDLFTRVAANIPAVAALIGA